MRPGQPGEGWRDAAPPTGCSRRSGDLNPNDRLDRTKVWWRFHRAVPPTPPGEVCLRRLGRVRHTATTSAPESLFNPARYCPHILRVPSMQRICLTPGAPVQQRAGGALVRSRRGAWPGQYLATRTAGRVSPRHYRLNPRVVKLAPVRAASDARPGGGGGTHGMWILPIQRPEFVTSSRMSTVCPPRRSTGPGRPAISQRFVCHPEHWPRTLPTTT
jgi:hypothetical protein